MYIRNDTRRYRLKIDIIIKSVVLEEGVLLHFALKLSVVIDGPYSMG